MAITAQKLLAISPRKSLLAPSGGGALVRIEKKVIRINSLVKSNLLLQKKGGRLAIREKENADLEKKEKDLEKQKPKGLNGIKVPRLPGFGFMGWIKNWIFNTLLGFITVRLIDYLPKMMNFVSIAGPAMEGILNFSGMLLNGMISFVDAGYKAVSATRGLVGKTFGNDALKNFDKLAGELEKFMNLAIIVGMASADFGMSRLGKKGAERAAEKGAGTLARRGGARLLTRAGARFGGRMGAKIGSKAFKAIPFLGAGLAIVEGIMRIKDGDYVGGLLSFGSAIPGFGWAFLALDIAREFMGGQEFDKSVGRAFSGKSGLTNRQVQNRTPSISGPSIMGLAGGGSTSPVKRRVSKVKRKVSAKAPTTKVKPGASVGGKQNIVKIFPESKKNSKSKQTNPLGYHETSAASLGKAPNFGPLFTIAMKTVLGEKPTLTDYKNAGIGLNAWAANSITNVGGFAGGGEVDGRMLFAGKDMSDAIAKSIETSVSLEVDRTINDLMKQLMLKPYEGKETTTTGQPSVGGQYSPEGLQGQIYQYLLSKGLDDNKALGIMANISRESGFRPGASESGGPGVGLFQYSSGGRKSAFLKAVPNYATNWKGQIDYALKEDAAPQYLQKQFSSPQEAADWWMKKWERPAEYIQNDKGPKIHAQYLASLEKYRTKSGYNIPVGAELGGMSGSLSAAQQLALSMGLQMTSHIRRGDRGYHGKGRAMDFSNGTNATPEMLNYANAMISKYGSSLAQLIYTPLGYGIANGKKVPLSYWGTSVNNEHYNHVHVAFAAGGRVSKPVFALIGEKGQEFVFDADTTKGMDQMMPGLLEHLNAAKTKPQLASILSSYSDDPGMILIPPALPSSPASTSGGGGGASSGSVNSQDNSWMFDRLATGTG